MFNDQFEKIKAWYRALPDKKKYVEFITALLTVPVLLTVLITNLSNINNNKKESLTPTSVPTEKIIYVTNPVSPTASTSPTLSPTVFQCKKQVGPVVLISPTEGQLVKGNSVCLQIDYKTGDYCSVVYSYRLDSGDWSDYTDKSICLFNLTPGPQSLELKVKSTESDDEIIILRNFYYKTRDTVTPTLTPTPGISGTQ